MKNKYKKIKFKHLYITGMFLLLVGFVLALNNFKTDQYQENLIQSLNTINNSASSVPLLIPATTSQVSNAEEFSYDVFQASQAIGENQPDSIPIYMRFVPFTGHYEAQRDINNANDILTGSKQSLIQVSQDTEYLLKFLFYAPAEEFASYGQNALVDDERIQRTKQGFQSIIDNPSLSETYKNDMNSAMDSLKELETSKDIQQYISSIANIQSQIIDNLNSDVAKEKSVIFDLYSQILYQ
jgi:hypothetical protein